MKRGFTLVEVMLASAIVCFSALALFEGVIVFTRIAHENSQLLQAEAVAWDAAWKRFNEGYNNLVTGETSGWRELPQAAAPELSVFDQPPKLKVDVQLMTTTGWLENMKVVTADLEWGPSSRRRRLSDCGVIVRVCRGDLGRAP